MPNPETPQTSASDAATVPGAAPTVVPAEHSLSELYTGGWRRRLSGLPSAVGRPLARWLGRGRSAVASARGSDRIGSDSARQ
jgi:hypothetical protein